MYALLVKILVMLALFIGLAWFGGYSIAHASMSLHHIMAQAMAHLTVDYAR